LESCDEELQRAERPCTTSFREPVRASEKKWKRSFLLSSRSSWPTDADGNIAQHVEYIPYGEVFVEERNNSFSTNYLFNAKELDNETGLYYYGARYLDPTGAMWLSVDPMWEKYAGMSPYNYCMGNPVKLVDPDGRSVEEESKIEIVPFKNVLLKISISLLEAKASSIALSIIVKTFKCFVLTCESLQTYLLIFDRYS